MIAPEIVTEYDNMTFAGTIFLRRESAAQKRRDTQQSKEIRGDGGGLDGFGPFFPADRKRAESVSGHLLEGGALTPPVQVIGRRNRKLGHAGEALGRGNVPDLHDPGRIVKG